jgi:hypothetical protein
VRNVYLCQVNWSNCSGNTAGYWIPYSVGSLWAYCRGIPEIRAAYELKDILFRRDSIASVIAGLEEPAVVGFSTYLWTEQYNFRLAQEIRKRWPGALIVFGGPQVPGDGRAYLAAHPMIDLVVHSEGEETFARILRENLGSEPDFRSIEGCSVNHRGQLTQAPPARRIRDLEALPSPYLEGIFDPLLAGNPDAQWNAVIETNRGCPYHCTFCDWGSLTYSKVTKTDRSRVLAEVEWLARNRISYVLPADANFGIFAERDQEIIDHFVSCKQQYGYPSAVGMSFAKNSNLKIVDMAEKLHSAKLLKAMTLSAQSMTPAVLEAIGRRNLAVSDFSFLLNECQRRGVPTYTELILGLPEETYATWSSGLCTALECGQHNQLESWLLELLCNAPLAQADSMKRYGLQTVRMKNYCFVFDSQDRDEVPEEVEIVFATATMPREDLERSLGFSMMIYNLHAYGWTQIVSRMLRRAGIGYSTFYGELEAWLCAAKAPILAREYQATRTTFRTMVDTGDYVVDRYLRNVNVGSVPIGLRSQGFLHLQADLVRDEIELFVLDRFGGELGELTNEVLRFQREFVTSPERAYPYEMQFQHDIAALIAGEPGAGVSCRYRFDITYPFDDLDDYLAKIYSRKKQGFGKAVLHKMNSSRKQVPRAHRSGRGRNNLQRSKTINAGAEPPAAT